MEKTERGHTWAGSGAYHWGDEEEDEGGKEKEGEGRRRGRKRKRLRWQGVTTVDVSV